VLVGAVVVAVVVGAVLLTRRRKGPAWPVRAGQMLDESDRLTTHLVGLTASGLDAVAESDAARLAALAAALQQLISSAPDETSRQALGAVEGPLHSLQSVVDAVGLAPGPASDADLQNVVARATRMHSATALARAAVAPRLPPSTGAPR
jgi:hypothetical protein